MRAAHRHVITAALAVAIALCAGCTGPAGSGVGASPTGVPDSSQVAPTPAGSRPASSASIAIVSPTANQVVTGTSVHIVIRLDGARIVSATTTNIRPDEGHIHLYVDNNLVSMNYSLSQDLPVHSGTYVVRAEFVAADHAPFNPRVVTPDLVFSVR